MSKTLKHLKILEDASIYQCNIKSKENDINKIEYISKLETFNGFKYNIYDHMEYKYIIFFEDNNNVSKISEKNIIKLPFTDESYYGIIYIFKLNNELNLVNLSTNRFISIFNKVKISKSVDDDYSSDDFNPDICDHTKKC